MSIARSSTATNCFRLTPNALQNFRQFDHINAPLPALTFGYEGLCLTDLPDKLHLRQTGLLASLTENLEKNGAMGGMDRFSLAFVNATESGYKPRSK